MGKALVLGGTRFFGVQLVESLLKQGFDVTIASRGNVEDSFGDKVSRIKFDRLDVSNMQKNFVDTEWDIVFDQICYSSQEAIDAIDVFKGKTKKYVFTSSKSVYESVSTGKGFTEEDFNPFEYSLNVGSKEDFSYGEGKRQAETAFFGRSPFPVVAVRFPIVIGLNDYTERLNYYIRKVRDLEDVHFVNLEAAMDFISEEEAGDFLAWVGQSDFEGPINATSNGYVRMGELLEYIEEKVEKHANVVTTTDEESGSPYNISETWLISNEKAKSLGYEFKDLKEYLPGLIGEALAKMDEIRHNN
ncbi:NAD-dependent epimerase/dehydratase family protein [Psychrobacillus psychrodurans]|uniref:NAD-dependent epimerase/dehydratase family protein n=1 Tax=Psychrobacillus psychrodurans TaxID=126157 RepID=UPI0008EEF7E1|nr:NAD-dependent epimerase/dehydratase family protein [Psychrobacillus psychrodurans]MCZ8539139.1 NAD-dependent epimerase/dehydratase family protein [Psychrobacillus psychrodurans]SFM28955.1 Nucleoside-diphosphate-sugar epimerase [Psychrobacillus psychrodurans]